MLKDPSNQVGSMPIKLPRSSNHARNFVDAIRFGQRSICDIETSFRSDTLCQLASIAVRTGRNLRWNQKSECFFNDKGADDLLKPRTFRGNWKLPNVQAVMDRDAQVTRLCQFVRVLSTINVMFASASPLVRCLAAFVVCQISFSGWAKTFEEVKELAFQKFDKPSS